MEGLVEVMYCLHVKCKALSSTCGKSRRKIHATQQIEVPWFEDSAPWLETLGKEVTLIARS